MSPGTVFLDRDGVLNVKAAEGSYITEPAELVLLPGVGEALRQLSEADLMLVVVTNQRGIATGIFDELTYQAVTARLVSELAAEGVRLDLILHCPHGLDCCGCRKPKPGLIDRAIAENPQISLAQAVMVGDAASDIELGREVGIPTVLISPEGTDAGIPADAFAPTLLAAVPDILSLVQSIR